MRSTWLTSTVVKTQANNCNALKEGAAASAILSGHNVGYCCPPSPPLLGTTTLSLLKANSDALSSLLFGGKY